MQGHNGFASFLWRGASVLLVGAAAGADEGDGSQESEQQDVLQQCRNTHAVLRGDDAIHNQQHHDSRHNQCRLCKLAHNTFSPKSRVGRNLYSSTTFSAAKLPPLRATYLHDGGVLLMIAEGLSSTPPSPFDRQVREIELRESNIILLKSKNFP